MPQDDFFSRYGAKLFQPTTSPEEPPAPEGPEQPDFFSRYGAKLYEPAAEPEPEPEPSPWYRRAADVGVSLTKGVASIPEAALGLADIVTGGHAGRTAEDYLGYSPQAVDQYLETLYTPEQRKAFENVRKAEGFIGTVQSIWDNPSVAFQSVVESVPSMLAGGAVGRGIAGAVPALEALAGGIGEGVISAGGAAEGARQQSADRLLSGKGTVSAIGSGIGTTALGALGGKVAKELGIADPESLIVNAGRREAAEEAGEAVAGATVTAAKKEVERRLATKIIYGAISEGLLEEFPQSIQEQVWSNYAAGKDLMDGVAQAAVLGAVAGGLMGGGANVYEHVMPGPPKVPPPATDPAAAATAGTTTPPPPGTVPPTGPAVTPPAGPPVTPPAAPPETPVPPGVLALGITPAMRSQLMRLGYTGDQIAQLTTEQAYRAAVNKTPPPAVVPPTEEEPPAATAEQPPPPTVTPPAAEEPVGPSGLTAAQQAQLRQVGFEQAQIDAMTPEEAQQVIAAADVTAEEPTTETAPTEEAPPPVAEPPVVEPTAGPPITPMVDRPVRPEVYKPPTIDITDEDKARDPQDIPLEHDTPVALVDNIEDRLVAAAQAIDPKVNPEVIRRTYQQRLAVAQETAQSAAVSDEEARASGRDPIDLVKAIASYGGINEADYVRGNAAWNRKHKHTGEIESLKEDAAGAGGKYGGKFGAMFGVRGVFREGGLPPDVLIQSLHQDPRFHWIETPSDLFEFLSKSATNFNAPIAKGGQMKLSDLHIDPTQQWWVPPHLRALSSHTRAQRMMRAGADDFDATQLDAPEEPTFESPSRFDMQGEDFIERRRDEAEHPDEWGAEAYPPSVTEALTDNEWHWLVKLQAAHPGSLNEDERFMLRELTGLVQEEIDNLSRDPGEDVETEVREPEAKTEEPSVEEPPAEEEPVEEPEAPEEEADEPGKPLPEVTIREGSRHAGEDDPQTLLEVMVDAQRDRFKGLEQLKKTRDKAKGKKKARLEGDYKAASQVYEDQWNEINDTFDGLDVAALRDDTEEPDTFDNLDERIKRDAKRPDGFPEEAYHALTNDEWWRLDALREKDEASDGELSEDETDEYLTLVAKVEDAIDNAPAAKKRAGDRKKWNWQDVGDWDHNEDPFPEPDEPVLAQREVTETIEQKEADARIARWETTARKIGKTQDNSNKIIISLFDRTGTWSEPWKLAGYDVRTYDISNGQDLLKHFPIHDIAEMRAEGKEIVGVLAAPPCTSFAVSGARWWKTQHDKANVELVEKKYGFFASEYFDTPVEYAQTLVHAAENVISLANPQFYALENPIGRMRRVADMPAPTLTFNPNHYGDPYTKKTQLFGEFNPHLPQANVVATKGSYTHSLRGNDAVEKLERSITPKGFAFAFFMANHGDEAVNVKRTKGEKRGGKELDFDEDVDEDVDEGGDKEPSGIDYYEGDEDKAQETQALFDGDPEAFKNAGDEAVSTGGDDVVLVHGKITNAEGKTFDHAWIEYPSEDNTFDPTTGIVLSTDLYREVITVKNEKRYTAAEAKANFEKTGHHGPWTKADLAAGKPPVKKGKAKAEKKASGKPPVLTSKDVDKHADQVEKDLKAEYGDRYNELESLMEGVTNAFETGKLDFSKGELQATAKALGLSVKAMKEKAADKTLEKHLDEATPATQIKFINAMAQIGRDRMAAKPKPAAKPETKKKPALTFGEKPPSIAGVENDEDQERLPGDVGEVRDKEVKAPVVELPQQTLTLSGQIIPEALKKKPPSLFDEPAAPEATAEQPDPNEHWREAEKLGRRPRTDMADEPEVEAQALRDKMDAGEWVDSRNAKHAGIEQELRKAGYDISDNGWYWKPKSDADEAPMFAKRSDGVTEQEIELDFDKKRMMQLLGPSMYEKPIQEVATKELLQNAFDAIKDTGATDANPGKVDIAIDESARTMTVSDNGVGMTPTIIKKAFFTIGGTHKEGKPENRSGGLGLAKMAFILGSKKIRVVTTRDGVTSTVEATSAQIQDQKFTVSSEKTGKPSGTTVTIWIPESFQDANDETQYIYMRGQPNFLSNTLLGPVEVKLNGEILPLGVNTPKAWQHENTFKFDWGTIKLHVNPNKVKYPSISVLSAGLHQFNVGSYAVFGMDDPVPYHMVLDVRPRVTTENPAYPFNNQRENFRGTVNEDIKAMYAFLKRMAIEQQILDAKDSFKDLEPLPKFSIKKEWTEADQRAYDKRRAEWLAREAARAAEKVKTQPKVKSVTITKEEVVTEYDNRQKRTDKKEEYVKKSFQPEKGVSMDALTLDVDDIDPTAPQFHNNTSETFDSAEEKQLFAEVGNVLLAFMREWGRRTTGTPYEAMTDTSKAGWFAGISLDKSYRGLNMIKPMRAIWFNPLYISDVGMSSPYAAASEALHIFIHEITHVAQRNEGAGFTAELANNYARIRAAGIPVEVFENALLRTFELHWDALKDANARFTNFNTKNKGGSFQSAAAIGPGESAETGEAGGRASELDSDRVSKHETEGSASNRGAEKTDPSAGPIGPILASKQQLPLEKGEGGKKPPPKEPTAKDLPLEDPNERVDRLLASFKEGSNENVRLEKEKQDAWNKKKFKEWWTRLKQQYLDKHAPILRRIKELSKKGIEIAQDYNPRYMLSELGYVGGKLEAWVSENVKPLTMKLAEHKIGWNEFGAFQFYDRIIKGDRGDIANPGKLTPETAQVERDALAKRFTPEQMEVIEDALGRFRHVVANVAREAHAAGIYSDEAYEEYKKNPAYATFRNIDKLARNITAKVYQQVGTEKDVEHVTESTILKMLVTIREVHKQKAKRATFAMLLRHYKNDIEVGKPIGEGKFAKPKNTDLREVGYFKNGVWSVMYVDPLIAHSLNNETVGRNNAIIEGVRFINGKIFRPLFVGLNPGFQSFNLVRDFSRMWKNFVGPEGKKMTLARAFQRYAQSLPIAKVNAFGISEREMTGWKRTLLNLAGITQERQEKALSDLNEAKKHGIFSTKLSDYFSDRQVEETSINELLAKYGQKQTEGPPRQGLQKATGKLWDFFDFIKNVGDYIETLPKAAAIYEMTSDGRRIADLTPSERALIREKIGTPDLMAGGTWKPVTNELFLFSNVILQGIRADWNVAKSDAMGYTKYGDPKTQSGWVWKTAMINVLPKMLMMAAVSGMIPGLGGEWLRKLFERVSEYDKTNYLILPLGMDEKGNAIYMRIPQDDTGRLMGGLAWKALRLAKGDKDFDLMLRSMVGYTFGQAPSVTPLVGGVVDVAAMAGGQNPYDDFRQRNLFTDQEMAAGGMQQWTKFLKWEAEQLGASTVAGKLLQEKRPEEKTGLQSFLDQPFASNIFGRWMRVSDQGLTESLKDVGATVKQDEARHQLSEREEVNAAIREYMKIAPPLRQGGSGKGARIAMARRLVDKVYADRPRKERNERTMQVEKKIAAGTVKGSADPLVDVVMSATTNMQKRALIEHARPSMSKEEFTGWLDRAASNAIISRELSAQIKRGQQGAR